MLSLNHYLNKKIAFCLRNALSTNVNVDYLNFNDELTKNRNIHEKIRKSITLSLLYFQPPPTYFPRFPEQEQ